MKRLGTFDLILNESHLRTIRGSKKKIPVEVFVDNENTLVILNCECCRELLASRLPGGVLIPIASALKSFFEERGMRNIDVIVSDNTMQRIYKGMIDESLFNQLKTVLQEAVRQYIRKRSEA